MITKPICPYCDKEKDNPYGVEMKLIGGRRVPRYLCPKCGALSPIATTASDAYKMASHQPLLELVINDYLEICDIGMCGGDSSVGIPGCPFCIYPDIDDAGVATPGGCMLELIVGK